MGESSALLKRGVDKAGDFFDGTVLLRYTPLPVLLLAKAVPDDGVIGLGTLVDFLEFLDETDTFLRMPPNFRRLSAPALAFDVDLPKPV